MIEALIVATIFVITGLTAGIRRMSPMYPVSRLDPKQEAASARIESYVWYGLAVVIMVVGVYVQFFSPGK